MNGTGIGVAAQTVAEAAVGEHLGEFGKELEMAFGGRFGHQEDEQQADRLTVRGLEGHRRGQAEKRAERFLEALDAAVGNRDALTEPGGTELFAGKERVINGDAGQSMVVFEEQSGLLKDAFLAAGFEIHYDIGGGE